MHSLCEFAHVMMEAPGTAEKKKKRQRSLDEDEVLSSLSSPDYKKDKVDDEMTFDYDEKMTVLEISKKMSLEKLTDFIEFKIGKISKKRWNQGLKTSLEIFIQRIRKELFPLRSGESSGVKLEETPLEELIKSNMALVKSHEDLVKVIQEQQETNKRLHATIFGMTEHLKEEVELSKGKEKPLIVAQKRESFAAVVRSKKEGVGASEVMKTVKETVKPAVLGLKIDSLRKGVNGAVIVKCRDEKSLKKFTARTEECKEVSVTNLKPLKAIITILGVHEEDCNEGFIEKMLNQNESLNSLVSSKENCKNHLKVVRYAKMNVNPYLRKVFIMVCAEIRKKMNELEGIHVGYRWAKVVDDTPLLQCYKCLSFGHISKRCKNEERCLYCAGRHQSNDCKFKENTDKHRCNNCYKYLGIIEANHKAISRKCMFYKKMQINLENKMVGGVFGKLGDCSP